MTTETVTITTTREGAELIRLSLAERAAGIRPWAEMPDEEDARASLARVERVQREVQGALERTEDDGAICVKIRGRAA